MKTKTKRVSILTSIIAGLMSTTCALAQPIGDKPYEEVRIPDTDTRYCASDIITPSGRLLVKDLPKSSRCPDSIDHPAFVGDGTAETADAGGESK